MKTVRLVLGFAAAAMCLRGSALCAAEKAPAAPLRIAVFVGNGARNVGAFRWLELTARAANCTSTPVDGEAVRNGALDGIDVLVVPGGSSGDEAQDLRDEGAAKVKAFVKRGGGYIGTCAGCSLVMEAPADSKKKRLAMIPFSSGAAGGAATMPIKFNAKAHELCGIKKGIQKVRYHGGPVLLPSRPVAEAQIEVIATYAGDVNSYSTKPRPSMAGKAAVVAGTYGKGKLFACAVHPESDVYDHGILKGAFKYVAGRDLAWDYPQRKRGQLAVGVVADHSFGIATAKFVQRLVTEGEFDVMPISAERISKEGVLRHLDAVLVPDGPGTSGEKKGLYGSNAVRTREFLARGGRIFAWGGAAQPARKHFPGSTCVADGEAALAALRAFAAQPVPPPPALPAKVPKPLKAAVYCDKDGGNTTIAKMLALSPEYELTFLRAAEYGKGGLDGIDLLIQPGGSCKGQYVAMGTNGVAALKRYIQDGGNYYGVCAGAFMALQQSRPGWPRLGIVPFKGDDPSHYRGGAPIKVELTEEGLGVFAGSEKSRTVEYFGGPVPIPGEPVAGTDVKVLARYAGRTINVNAAHGHEPVEAMDGKGAFFGGTVGKGRVFLSCPHPEFTESTHDIVRSGIKFLTGVAPSPVNCDRVRGAVSVIYYPGKDDDSLRFCFGTLLRDRRFDVQIGGNANDFAHADAIVVVKPDAEWLSSSSVRRFAKNGGRVVAVAHNAKEREAAAKLKHVTVVGSCAEILDALL